MIKDELQIINKLLVTLIKYKKETDLDILTHYIIRENNKQSTLEEQEHLDNYTDDDNDGLEPSHINNYFESTENITPKKPKCKL